jgi:hypothetical protein
MSNKKVLREGIIDKITQFLIKGKVNKVVKAFNNDPSIKKAVQDYQVARAKLDKSIKNWDELNQKKLNPKLRKIR